MKTIMLKSLILCPVCNELQELANDGRWYEAIERFPLSTGPFSEAIDSICDSNKNVERLQQDPLLLPRIATKCDTCGVDTTMNGARRWWLVQSIIVD